MEASVLQPNIWLASSSSSSVSATASRPRPGRWLWSGVWLSAGESSPWSSGTFLYCTGHVFTCFGKRNRSVFNSANVSVFSWNPALISSSGHSLNPWFSLTVTKPNRSAAGLWSAVLSNAPSQFDSHPNTDSLVYLTQSPFAMKCYQWPEGCYKLALALFYNCQSSYILVLDRAAHAAKLVTVTIKWLLWHFTERGWGMKESERNVLTCPKVSLLLFT